MMWASIVCYLFTLQEQNKNKNKPTNIKKSMTENSQWLKYISIYISLLLLWQIQSLEKN